MPREINQVIEQLSKIEASSAEILSGAEEQKRAYAAEMEQKKKEFDNALSEQTEAKLKELRDTLNAEAEQKRSRIGWRNGTTQTTPVWQRNCLSRL